MTEASRDRWDAVIVGGGHNGLTAAAYLAGAGLRVLLLERLDHVGGAAVSDMIFPGVDARISRYSYLVSLLPDRIRRDLRLDVVLARRRYSSYTPLPGTDLGLLVDSADPVATAASFTAVGAASDVDAWDAFGAATGALARAVFPTVCDPLLTRSELRGAVDAAAWDAVIQTPIGETIAERFTSDLVRGVLLTDALIGTFAPTIDESLAANRCFLYHVIGGGTGHWDVPVGGMGAVSSALARAAREAGAVIVTAAEVTAVTPDGGVTYLHGDTERTVGAQTVLAGCAPAELNRLLGAASGTRPEGAQVKVNLLLSRLPRLRDRATDAAAAFGGTFHVNEGWGALEAAYSAATDGRIPDPLPVESYCHSLTDPSIVSPDLRASGAQTLTVFALQTPDRLLADRVALGAAVLASLDSVLDEPVAELIAKDGRGEPCIEVTTTRDLEANLRMPGGNIFHGALDWPFVEDDAPLSTAPERWGVATEHPGILLCGAGARRGGAVSGIGGHNAAMAVLEARSG